MSEVFNGIDRIEVENYKAIRKQSIEIKPVTVLAGPNSSGKSSMMQPLLLMKQTLDAHRPSPLRFGDGLNVNVTSFDQINSKIPNTSKDWFSVLVENNVVRVKPTFYKSDEGVGLKSVWYEILKKQKESIDQAFDVTLFPQMSQEELKKWMMRVYREFSSREITENVEFEVVPDRCFFRVVSREQLEQKPFSYGFRPAAGIASDIQGIIHLSGLRGNPERVYTNQTLTHPFYVGTFQDYTANLIEVWQKENNSKYHSLIDYLQKLHLSTGIKVNRIDESNLEVLVGWHLTKKLAPADMVSIADVGVGVSQALPILAALITAEPNQVVYIEQPGIHLHPSAHIGLVDAILDAAIRGVKVVVETHSATFLLTLQTVIAEQKCSLNHDKIALYWFSRENDGSVKIVSGKMAKDGTYGDFPVNFSNVTMELQKRFMDAFENGEYEV